MAATPTRPPMPPLFSTTTCWPSSADRPRARVRPNMSEGPPAANGTYKVIGRFGQACARAPLDATSAAALAALRTVLRLIVPPSLHGLPDRELPARLLSLLGARHSVAHLCGSQTP